MLTCGLVRSNFAFATVVLLGTLCTTPDDLWLGRGALWLNETGLLGFSVGQPTGTRGMRFPSLSPGLLDDLLGDVRGNLGVGVELHGVVRTTLGLGPQVADIPEHLRQRNQRLHDASATALLHGLNLATARVQVTDNVTHVVLGRGHLDRH